MDVRMGLFGMLWGSSLGSFLISRLGKGCLIFNLIPLWAWLFRPSWGKKCGSMTHCGLSRPRTGVRSISGSYRWSMLTEAALSCWLSVNWKTTPLLNWQYRCLQMCRGNGLRQCYSRRHEGGEMRTSWRHLKHNCVEIHVRLMALPAQKWARMTYVAGTESCCQNIPMKQKQMLLVTASTIQWYCGHLTNCTTFSCLWVVVWHAYCDFTAEEYPGDPQTRSPQDSHSL